MSVLNVSTNNTPVFVSEVVELTLSSLSHCHDLTHGNDLVLEFQGGDPHTTVDR